MIMLKMFFIILLSVFASVATTIGVMMRYSNVASKQILPAKQTISEVNIKPQKISARCQNEAEVKIIPDLKETIVNPSPGDAPGTVTESPLGQFDYQKLNNDLRTVSSALERFNSMIYHEIQRLKGDSLPGIQQDNSNVDKLESK